MIVMHAMDATHDLPHIGIQQGDGMYHVLSDLPGSAGTAELLTFIRKCGASDTWMQAVGTYREHYDVHGVWAERVQQEGARLVHNRELYDILARKRAARLHDAITVPAVVDRQWEMIHSLAGFMPENLADYFARALCDLIFCPDFLERPARTIALINGHSGHEVATAFIERLAFVAPDCIVTSLSSEQRSQIPTFRDVDLIVDMLGMGQSSALSEDDKEIIHSINESRRPILSFMLPMGIYPNGEGSEEMYVQATATLAVTLPLRALTLNAYIPSFGDIWLEDIGVSRRLFKQVGIFSLPYEAQPLERLIYLPLAPKAPDFSSDVMRLVYARSLPGDGESFVFGHDLQDKYLDREER
jgi:YjeF-related protein N-terminus/Protein of unknown function (DUF4031)